MAHISRNRALPGEIVDIKIFVASLNKRVDKVGRKPIMIVVVHVY